MSTHPASVWVKICANTSADDALLAAQSGADAVGFVFAPSTRRVTPVQVAAISARLEPTYPKVSRIGVFDALDADNIPATVREARLTGVQLHFDYSRDLLTHLRRQLAPDIMVIQAAHWRVGQQAPGEFAAHMAILSTVRAIDAALVDSRTAAASGGTGIAFDWAAARHATAALSPTPLIVAGGLTPANVAEAIRVLLPWGVDVASGVESTPGRKDPAKVRTFIQAARRPT